ncbi:MAG: RHS repeat-associated core domain-containing protein [Mangrovibacterium sp.]
MNPTPNPQNSFSFEPSPFGGDGGGFPFGEVFIEERNNTWNTPFLFNGKEFDSETGLYYYGARYYNPRVSIWHGVDPLATYNPVIETEHYIDGQHNGGVFNSFNLNVYGYCYQNPVKLVDPNGKQASFEIRMQHRDRAYLQGNLTKEEHQAQVKAEAVGGLIGAYVLAEVLVTRGKMTKSIIKSNSVTAGFTGAVDVGFQLFDNKKGIDFSKTGDAMLNSVDIFDGALGAFNVQGKYNVTFEVAKILAGGIIDVGPNGEMKTVFEDKSLLDAGIDAGAGALLQYKGIKGKFSAPAKRLGYELGNFVSDKFYSDNINVETEERQ